MRRQAAGGGLSSALAGRARCEGPSQGARRRTPSGAASLGRKASAFVAGLSEGIRGAVRSYGASFPLSSTSDGRRPGMLSSKIAPLAHAKDRQYRMEAAMCVEGLALITSLAALVVSVIALYLASLRRANVEIDPVEKLSEPRERGSVVHGRPQETRIELAVSAWNTGAQGGVLEGLRVSGMRPAGPWIAAEPIACFEQPHGTNPVRFPVALKAGDVQTFFIQGALRDNAPHGADFVRDLSPLTSFEVTIEWTFLRTETFPWRLRRQRVSRRRTRAIRIDPSGYRARLEATAS